VARLKMEAIISSETPVHIRTIRSYIPEDYNVHNYRCENLNSYVRGEIPICALQRRVGFEVPGFAIQSAARELSAKV
jgi:hypothetical protein